MTVIPANSVRLVATHKEETVMLKPAGLYHLEFQTSAGMPFKIPVLIQVAGLYQYKGKKKLSLIKLGTD